MKPALDLTGLPELTPALYLNRELAWIEFNRRVLEVAKDEALPLLERLKFVAIFSSNMDEFFMVRVGYVHNKVKLGMPSNRPDGMLPPQLLDEIRRRVLPMMQEQRALIRDLLARLEDAGVRVGNGRDLPAAHQAVLRRYFAQEVYPVLTPLAVDRARPFPFISNLSLNFAIWLRRQGKGGDDLEFVRLKVPDVLPRLVNLATVLARYGDGERLDGEAFVWLEDIIAENLDMLFPGMDVLEQAPFRLTRNADFDYESENEENESLDELVQEGIRERRFGPIVRLSIPKSMSDRTRRQLIRLLQIDPARDIYEVDGALGMSSLWAVVGADRADLKAPPHLPRHYDHLDDPARIFDTIRQGDVLLHHPYDSFTPVENFFEAAARDPNVLAIKTTLYRVGRNSPIVRSLMAARDNDKQVSVLVELKARFDEENNLEWARALDEKGVHVIYGVEDLSIKTHAKVSMVVRREPDGVRRYIHLSTGNYNVSTSRLYTDVGLFTCQPDIGEDASRLFNRLTGYAPGTTYERLLVAPEYLLPRFLQLIDNEIEAARAGKAARLLFKMNQLEEDAVIRKLYQASQAGVQIDLIVRGLCCLVPGVAGLSENIRVRSIVSRFLEHARMYYFHNAPPDERLYLGSADLMRRNLYNRVEVVFPVLDPRLQALALNISEIQLRDNAQAWAMQPDGTYQRIQPGEGEAPLNSQEVFMASSFG
jgi:polyphosphate kinase